MSTGIVTVAAFAPLTLGVTALGVFLVGPQLPIRRSVARYDWPVWTAEGDGPHRICRRAPRPGGAHRRQAVELAQRAAWLNEIHVTARVPVPSAPVRIRTLPRRRLAEDWRLRMAGITIPDRVSLPGGITA